MILTKDGISFIALEPLMASTLPFNVPKMLDQRFIIINTRLQRSAMGKAFEEGRMNIPQPAALGEGGPILPYCLVGDEAFPLKPYLLRPYPGRGLTPEQEMYNYRLSRARRIIENVFGILASQWRVYRKPIIASPDNAKLMVQATICLHNWLRRQDIDENAYVPPGLIDVDDPRTVQMASDQGLGVSSWKMDAHSETSQTVDRT
ncbi:uncharacterized protein [Temnothorax longispinosus]|uniref:uncharacterized protein n=1 Tax=Temnothorax longispinosus TaxID=300112 RepID=UPI003A990C64